MLDTGWFRLWVVSVVALTFALLAIAAYAIWEQDACYRYVTISTNDDGFVSDQDAELVKHLRKEISSREYCGTMHYSMLTTLEELAKKGFVTQIAIQWQEPRGWSFEDFDSLDVLDGPDIRAAIVLERVHRYVREARLRSFIPWTIALAVAAAASLALGIGIAWVRRGFGR